MYINNAIQLNNLNISKIEHIEIIFMPWIFMQMKWILDEFNSNISTPAKKTGRRVTNQPNSITFFIEIFTLCIKGLLYIGFLLEFCSHVKQSRKMSFVKLKLTTRKRHSSIICFNGHRSGLHLEWAGISFLIHLILSSVYLFIWSVFALDIFFLVKRKFSFLRIFFFLKHSDSS